jgi:ferredoxin
MEPQPQPKRRGPVSSSTRAFMREFEHLRGSSWWDKLHGYVYSAYPYFYIKAGTGEHRFSGFFEGLFNLLENLAPKPPDTDGRSPGFADTYHGKVLPLEAARQLLTVNRSVDLGDLEQVVPYAMARDIVLKNPDHIVVLDCPCRAARPNPCLPLDVCLIVGEPFAGFIAEHHPRRSRWVSQQEAVEILKAEDERGHAHHAFFKDAMLGRFYAICNCCSCCCGAMQAQRNGTPMLCSSGYVCVIDEAACEGCGQCAGRCQFGAIELSGGKARVSWDACMGCGTCMGGCEHGAARLVRDEAKGEPLVISELMAKARGSVGG